MEKILDSEHNELKLAIFRALAWFDGFDYPLSSFELWQFLEVRADFNDVLAVLSSESGLWSFCQGFYCLFGREAIIETRQKRYNYTDRKMKIALRISRLFSVLPSVKMVAAANLIGAHNLRDESDIDLFIITSKRRLWLTRFLCAGLAKILNLRPNQITKKDKVCLSFYVSEDNLSLENFCLPEEDYYFYFWIMGLSPVLNRSGIYERFCASNNWLLEKYPNFIWPQTNRRRLVSGKFQLPLILFPQYLEALVRKIQLKIMPAILKNQAGQGGVILENNILKLYRQDRRSDLRAAYRQKIKAYEKI